MELYTKRPVPPIATALTGWLPTELGNIQRATMSLGTGVTINVQRDFGARGDGVTNDTRAVQAAMHAAAGNVLVFPPGAYLLTAEIEGVSNVVLVFNGCTILGNATRIRSFFHFANQTNITWVGPVTFDLGQPILPTYNDYPTFYQLAAYFETSSNVTITDYASRNLYTKALYFFGCGGTVRLMRLRMTSPPQAQMLMLEHLAFQTCTADISIEDIYVDNAVSGAPTSAAVVPCGIFASGTRGKFLVDGGAFNYCGRNNDGGHRLAVIDFYGDSQHVTFRNLVSTNQMAQFTRLSSVADVLVDGLTVEMAPTAEPATQIVSVESTITFAGVGQTGTQRVTLRTLDFTDLYDATRTGVAIGSYDYSVPATDILVEDLRVNGLKTAVLIGGPYQNITMDLLEAMGANGGTISVVVSPPGVIVTALNGVTEAQSAFNNLRMSRVTTATSSVTAAPIIINLTKVPEYTGSVGLILVDDCILAASAASAATGISVRLTSASVQGRVLMRRNDLTQFAVALAAQYVGQFTYEDTTTRLIGTAQVSTSTVGMIVAHGNRWSSGPASGQVVLSGGTATVTTAEVIASDNILLTSVVPGGTAGALTVGTITPGVSFVVASSSAADTATVYWEIRH